MKKYLAFVLCIIMMLSLCACNDENESSSYPDLNESSSSETQESERGGGKLIINGKEITASFTVYQTHAELPLVAILEGLGYVISWTSDTNAAVFCNTSIHTLNLEEKTFINEATKKNVIPLYGNNDYKCEAIERDIIVDDVTLYEIMINIQHPITLSLDYDALTVTINNK